MTSDIEAPQEKRFVSGTLPWVVAGVSLGCYLVTLNQWITASNLGAFARVAGYQWQPSLSNPLYFLLTQPLAWLPAAWIPIGVNAFSAVCAALALALLARAVALLPHDRTERQRRLEANPDGLLTIGAAWVPVVFAVVTCGLSFMFWERATSGGPEMLGLLLFAYVVRALLEYRRSGRETWLLKAVFVYALSMTENWLAILLLPAFLVSLIWLMGFAFFNGKFLLRALALALAGLSFYLVLPACAMLHADAPAPFWPALKFVLGGQKSSLILHWQRARGLLVLAALPSLLPLFIMGLRFRTASFGDTSVLGSALAGLIFHVLHGAFLVFCAWVALDPPFSPGQSGLGAQFLPVQFLASLSVGYLTGYFLLLFGPRAWNSRHVRGWHRKFHMAVASGAGVFAVLFVIAALYRNLPLIRANNGDVLRHYATQMARALPDKPAVILSDDPRRLWLVQTMLADTPTAPKHLAVDTRLLNAPDYHRTLHRQSGGFWPLPPTDRPPVEHAELIKRILEQSGQREVWYLHPSFGYYFEFLHPEPHGIASRLIPYSTNAVFPPALSGAVLEENIAFWNSVVEGDVPELTRALIPRWDNSSTNRFHRLLNKLRITPGMHLDAFLIGGYHSRSLNTWGVELQRLGRLDEAGEMFSKAAELSAWNVVARVNRQFNQHLVRGEKSAFAITGSIEDQFGAYRSWDDVIGQNGPFDEPRFCYEQGRAFAGQSLYRQAIHVFERVRTLAPDDVFSRLWLANIYLVTRLNDQALAVVDEVKRQPERFALTSTNRIDFLTVEALARLGRGELKDVDALLQATVNRDPTNYYLLANCAQVYLRSGLFTNAVVWLDRQLRINPADTDALMNKGYACLRGGAFQAAIPALDRLMELQPSNHYALINRAIANLQAGEYDAADRDYRALSTVFTNAYQVHFGQGEIAWRRKNTNDAIRSFELYLRSAPTNTPEARLVTDRLRQLKAVTP